MCSNSVPYLTIICVLFLFDYDIISNIRMFANMNAATSADITRAFALGGFYIIASTVGGIFLFKRSEIK